MSYSLQDFCTDVRTVLGEADNAAARDQVRAKLELLLADADFLAEHVGPESEPGMQQIYQDAESGFCVLTYNMAASRQSPPHDHGNSWAVYGQAVGYTDMTLWDESDGKVQEGRKFRLNAGDAGLFDVRAIHSIDYAAGAKFVRVTGVDMSGEPRRVFDPKAGAMRQIESVGAGSN